MRSLNPNALKARAIRRALRRIVGERCVTECIPPLRSREPAVRIEYWNKSTTKHIASIKTQLAAMVLFIVGAGLVASTIDLSVSGENVGPIFVSPALVVDRLKVRVEQPISVEFRIHNFSSGMVEILNLHTGCTCTGGTLSQNRLKKGEVSVVTLRTGGKAAVGPFEINATLEYKSDAQEASQLVYLSAKGKVLTTQ